MEKLKQLIAFLFQRSGKEILRDDDIYAALSYELGWLTPAQSMGLIEDCLKKGLLVAEEEGYKPAFDYTSMEIPLGFKIDGSMMEIPSSSNEVLPAVISEIAKNGVSENSARDGIMKKAEKEHIIPEVAALIVAKEHGIDVSPFIKDAWNIIKNM